MEVVPGDDKTVDRHLVLKESTDSVHTCQLFGKRKVNSDRVEL